MTRSPGERTVVPERITTWFLMEQSHDERSLADGQVFQGAQMGRALVQDELGGLRVGVCDPVQGEHDAAALVLQPPDQPEDAGHSDELGGHHAIKARQPGPRQVS